MNTTKLKLISQAEVENGSVKGFPDVVAGDATVLKNAFVEPSLNIAKVMNDNTNALIVVLNSIYPVGSIYQSINAINPQVLFGGTWQRFGNGRVLVGVDENDTEFNVAQKIGGEKAHTLTVAELAAHNHRISTNRNPSGANKEFLDCSISFAIGGMLSSTAMYNTGGNQAHNNIQPYITVYTWLRIA